MSMRNKILSMDPLNIPMQFLKSRSVRRRQLEPCLGFTLIELLVVIVVLGILLSLLLPAFNSIREGARQSVCSNQLRQLGLGLQQYESRNGAFPAACCNGMLIALGSI